MPSEKERKLYEKIESPIHFSTIESNVEKEMYDRLALFDTDVNCFFANAIECYGNESPEATVTMQLQTIYARKKADLLDKLLGIDGHSFGYMDEISLIDSANQSIDNSLANEMIEIQPEVDLETTIESNSSYTKIGTMKNGYANTESSIPCASEQQPSLIPDTSMPAIISPSASKEEGSPINNLMTAKIDDYLSGMREKFPRTSVKDRLYNPTSVKSRLGSRRSVKLRLGNRKDAKFSIHSCTANTLLQKWREDSSSTDSKILEKRALRFAEREKQLNLPRNLNEIEFAAEDENAASPEVESELKAAKSSIKELEAAQILISMNKILPPIRENDHIDFVQCLYCKKWTSEILCERCERSS